MLEVANKTLTPVDRKQKQDYISEETWQKIVTRQTAHENWNLLAVRDLSLQIKHMARRDKRHAVLESIEKSLIMKKGPHPRFIHMKNLDGEFCGP